MLFCSQTFLFFFLIVAALHWTLSSAKIRVWWLLSASIFFYASWNRWLAVLIVASTTFDYLVARAIDASKAPRRRRALLLLSIASNLGLLAYFKYANFFLGSLERALAIVGRPSDLPMLSVILPIGISFYTFEAISYVVDVHHGRVRAERRLDHLLLFILFFPHLIAGPIVRPRHFLPQIRRPKRWSWIRAQVGLELFLRGLFKKMALADRMALAVDPVFANPHAFGSGAARLAVLAYAIQIYCDFSGYTDMALGCAHLLGYKLPVNFRAPYLARNATEFWRRWHISLSSWLRDYLYVSMGGNRGNAIATGRNLLVTMTLGGLWHGAQWSFVLWGLAHGVLLIAHRGLARLGGWLVARGARSGTLAARIVGTTATLAAVCLLWVLFRAQDFSHARALWGQLFFGHGGRAAPLPSAVVACALLLVLADHRLASVRALARRRDRVPAPVIGLAYAAGLILALVLAPDAGKAFIYFQF